MKSERKLFGPRRTLVCAIALVCLAPNQALGQVVPAAMPHKFVVEGRLYDSVTNQPLATPSANIKFELVSGADTLDSDTSCVLFSEEFTGVNLDNADSSQQGVFALKFGSGTRLFPPSTPSFVTLFSPGNLTGMGSCAITAAATDHRFIKVSVDKGSGYDSFPLSVITASPLALVAESAATLQGYGASAFVLQNGSTASLTQANLENIFSSTNYTKLTDLLSGVSTQYLPAAPTAAVSFNNQRITNLAAPGTTSDAVNKGYADAYVGGKTVDVTGVGPATGDGKTLIWDQAQNKWVAGVPVGVDNTKLPLSGGTMSGALSMGGNDLSAIGNVSISAQKSLKLGSFTDAQEATLVLSLAAVDQGVSWYNTDHNVFKIWNGSTAVDQVYLTTGKLNASWFPNTSVTPGTYGSSTTIPVFTVGADGRLTAAYGTTVSGVSPGGVAGGDLTGTYPNPTIQDNAVTASKIADDSITSAKIKSASVAVNRLVATDASTGSTLTYFTCALGEIMYWTATGWGCTTVTALAPVKTVAGKSPDVAGNVALNLYDVGGGPAGMKDYGTAAGNLVELDGAGKIPTSVLPTGLSTITSVSSVSPLIGGGTTGAITISIDVGVGSNKVLQLNGSGQVPAVDGSLIQNVNAAKIGSWAVGSTPPTLGYVLTWNGSQWQPANASTGTVTTVAAGLGLTGGTFTTGGTLAVDIGTTALKITQFDASARYPGNDGSLIQNVNAAKIGTRFVSSSIPTPGYVLTWNGSQWEPNSAPSASFPLLASPGTTPHGSPSYSFSGDSDTGMLSPSQGILAIATNGTARLIVDAAGNTGIGTLNPRGGLDIATNGTGGSALVIPRDTTANRPTTAASLNGMIRYNTTTDRFEGFQGGVWTNIISAGGSSFPLLATPGTSPLNAPPYSFAGDTGTGLLSPTNGTLTLVSGGSAMVTVNPGGVGIGTQSISAKLHVQDGNLELTNDNYAGQLLINSASSSGSDSATLALQTSRGTMSSRSYLQSGDALGQLLFNDHDDATERAAIRAIATEAHSSGAARGTALGFFATQTGTNYPSEFMRINHDGRVGIGTQGPQAALDVNATGSGSAIIVPRDTISNRPTSPISGMIRYNISTTKFEAYENGAWVNMIGGSMPSLSGLTSATATNSISNGGFSQIWSWTALSSGASGLALDYSTAGGNGASALKASVSNVSSSAMPFFIENKGTGPSFRIDDQATDPSPFLIDDTGRVGVGTANPMTALHVYEDTGSLPLRVETNNTTAGIQLIRAGGIGGSISVGASGDMWIQPSGNLRLWANSSERMRVDSNGVGIGTTAPQRLLHVGGPVRFEPVFAMPGSAAVGDLLIDGSSGYRPKWYNGSAWESPATVAGANGEIQFNNGGQLGANTKLHWDNVNGYLGVGASAPGRHLDIQAVDATTVIGVTNSSSTVSRFPGVMVSNYNGSTSGEPQLTLANWGGTMAAPGNLAAGKSVGSIYFTSGNSGGGNNPTASIQAYSGSTQTSSNSDGYLIFSTTPSGTVSLYERMRITAAGNVGVGTTGPRGGLEIATTGTGGSVLVIPRDTTPNRPTTAASLNGMIRYNTTNNKFEGFEAGSWTNMISTGGSFPMLASPGTAPISGPSYSFTGDSDTGLLSQSTGSLTLATNGTARLQIAASGSIGIGTGAPNGMLEIRNDTNQDVAAIRLSNATNGSAAAVGIYFTGDGVIDQGWIGFNSNSASNPPYAGRMAVQSANTNSNGLSLVTSNSTADIRLYTGAETERVRVTSGGNMGVGTTLPRVGLDVATTGTGGSAIVVPRDSTANRPTTAASLNGMIRYNTTNNKFEGFEAGSWTNMISTVSFPLLASPGTAPLSAPSYSFTGDPDTGLLSQSVGTLALASNGTARISIDTAGNVGIGTTSPSSRFTISETRADTAGSYFAQDIMQLITNSAYSSADFTATRAYSQRTSGQDVTAVTGALNFGENNSAGGTLGYLYGSRNWATNTSGLTSYIVGSENKATITSGNPTTMYGANNLALRMGSGTTNQAYGSHSEVLQTAGVTTTATGVSAAVTKSGGTINTGYGVYIGSVQATTRYGLYSSDSAATSYFAGYVGIGTNVPSGGLDIATTGTGGSAIVVPRDTTANRPTTAASVNGMIRYNNSTAKFEAFEAGAWTNMIPTGTAFPLLASPGTAPLFAPSYSFNGDSDTGLLSQGPNSLTLATGGTARLILSPSGETAVTGTFVLKPATPNATYNVDFSTGNIQYTTNDCGSFTFTNMKDGGSYAMVVKGTNSTTCSFTHSGLTFHLPPDHTATIPSKHTFYNFTVVGTDVYTSWTPGY